MADDDATEAQAEAAGSAAVEKPVFTGRPADKPSPNTTFAQRAAGVSGAAVKVGHADEKAVQAAENKAVKKASTKRN